MATGTGARLATLGILVAVFGAGLAIGVAVDRQVSAAETPPRTERVSGGEAAPEDPPSPRRMMIEEVGLSPEQALAVDSVVRARQEVMRELQREYRTLYWEVVDTTRANLRQLLSPDQAVHYDSLVAENDSRRRPEAVRIPRN